MLLPASALPMDRRAHYRCLKSQKVRVGSCLCSEGKRGSTLRLSRWSVEVTEGALGQA